ncbi:hypothetical protein HIM_05011 [Hirsutella minnesotensis 3608]|uniref:Tyrosine specific protein phosphatases domain-containing protein n=1 Tax=Hirsutella minnesotensis 3608 TaxID=1043627 RepID=A0A0F7ZUW0_9HYPO|nr:hypothetical protein HIM_05011 [Hirsutella minnesotensis 3608]
MPSSSIVALTSATSSSGVAMDQPIIELRQVRNFRDVGYTVNCFLGRKLVREGVFFRSARPDGAGAEDEALIRDRLGVKTIIDLRTETEHRQRTRKQQPDASESASLAKEPSQDAYSPSVNGVAYKPVKVIGRSVERHLLSQLSWSGFFKTIGLHVCGYRKQAARVMAQEVLVPMGLPGMSNVILDHAGPEICDVLSTYTSTQTTPTLVHCTLGKDRTGFICALVLFILNVPVSAIEHDYFLTEPALLPDRPQRVLEMRNAGFTEEWADTAKGMITGMENHMASEYGGLEAYLDHIGFLQSDREKLREVLLY